MKTTQRSAFLGVGVLATLALAACSSSTPPKASSRTTAPTEVSTTTTTAAATTTSTTGSTTCQPSQVPITVSGTNGAAGTIELTFSFTNTSATTCTMEGYPGMQLLGAGGTSLPTNVIRGGGLAFENVAVSTVTLTHGQVAYFNLGYSDVTQGSSSCSMATEVEITPPNDTANETVPVQGIAACGGGELHVSPVFASTDAAATSTTAPPS